MIFKQILSFSLQLDLLNYFNSFTVYIFLSAPIKSFVEKGQVGVPGWLSLLNIQLQHRSWFYGSWVWTLHWAHCHQQKDHFGSSVPNSLSKISKHKKKKKRVREKERKRKKARNELKQTEIDHLDLLNYLILSHSFIYSTSMCLLDICPQFCLFYSVIQKAALRKACRKMPG